MIVTCYTFSKEINSTKIPAAGAGTDITMQLKAPCSILNPSFIIGLTEWNSTWNYVHIPAWNRYYFVHNSTILTGNRIEVECGIDVLASYRSEIRSTSAYVRRSASNYDTMLEDSSWTHDMNPIITQSEELDPGYDGTGTVLLFTACKRGEYGTAIYAMLPADLQQFAGYLFSQSFFDSATEGIAEGFAAFAKSVFNPFSYIVRCMWVPFNLRDELDVVPVSFGWWDSPFTATLVHQRVKSGGVFNIWTGVSTDWTDKSDAWTRHELSLQGFGQIPISAEYTGRTLTGQIVMDIVTGIGTLFIKDSTGALIQTATAQLGCDIQLSSLYEDIVSDFGSVGSAVGTLVRGAAGVVTNVANAITSGSLSEIASNMGGLTDSVVRGAESALQPTLSRMGASGNYAAIQFTPNRLTTTHYSRYSDDHERLGGMCCKVLTLSGLSGYTEIVNPHVEINGTSLEITMINQFLSGGFYLE